MHNGDDDHLRRLLDQRSQRADVPSPLYHFPSVSERSDSPSLYSHFSPAQHGYASPIALTPASHFPAHPPLADYSGDSTSFHSSRDRLAADPDSSTVDFDDDSASESDSRFIAYGDPESFEPEDVDHDDDNEFQPRMSLLGPKVRVHSRAPWETGDDDIAEEDQDEGESDGLSVFGGGKRRIRGFGFGLSSNPKPNTATSSRPSIDSSTSKSTAKSKKSSETSSSTNGSSSFNALHALAHASMSSTSLAIAQTSASSKLPHKLSMSRLTPTRSRTTSSTSSRSVSDVVGSVPPPLPSPRSTLLSDPSSVNCSPTSAGPSPVRSEFSTGTNSRTRSPSPFHLESGYVHPYANPDLLSASNRDSILTPFGASSSLHQRKAGGVTRSDSSATLTASQETVIMSRSTSASTVLTESTSSTGSYITPVTSSYSLADPPASPKPPVPEKDKDRSLRLLRRETRGGPINISAPTIGDFTPSSPYTLITLEQAQARVKERSRSVTVGAPPSASSSKPIPFPSHAFSGSENIGSPTNVDGNSRTRSRTSSAGTRVKHALGGFTADSRKTPEKGSSELQSNFQADVSTTSNPVGELPPGKTLKSKRSGFMKLFQGKEKDQGTNSAPPVPPLDLADSDWRPQQTYAPAAVVTTKPPMPRVPVPSLSPPIVSASVGEVANVVSTPKRPGLSIKVTSPAVPRLRTPSARPDVRIANASDSPTLSLKKDENFDRHLLSKPPSSAPPGTTQFSPLNLRPVSTIFSNYFADHIVDNPGHNPGLSPPTGTDMSSPSPQTPPWHSRAQSAVPVRPSFSERSSSDGSSVTPLEDQSSIVLALKEQMISQRNSWQLQVRELEGQVRDLKAQLEELRSGDACDVCGRGGSMPSNPITSIKSVIDRPRPKLGTGAWFTNAA